MQISFPYPNIAPIDVPDKNLLGVFSPSTAVTAVTGKECVDEALRHPIGSEPLPEKVRGCKDILILVDDHTRTTPVAGILPSVIEQLRQGDVRKDHIKIMVALGTHRPMTGEEIVKKFGKEIPRQYPILNHNWSDASQLLHIGDTEKGTPIFVNRIVKEVDFIIGIGQIVPHRVSGFSGGGNIVQPGICGEETTGRTHWLSAQFSGREILGKIENPVKHEIERVAEAVGLKWIVNAILDGAGRLVEVVAGDPLRAFRAGAVRSTEIYRSEMDQEADIVISDSHPYDSDLWVASKGIYASELAVRQGGVVILVSPCTEGVCPSHPEVLEHGYQTFKEVEEKVRQGKMKKLTVAAHLVHVGRIIKERAIGILVCPGISEEETKKLGLIYARTPREALEIGFSLTSREAKVAVLQRGGEILPVIKPIPT
jgi:nickel-dependent lactate racemase